MPDYLGEDQRKSKPTDNKEEEKPIKGRLDPVVELLDLSALF